MPLSLDHFSALADAPSNEWKGKTSQRMEGKDLAAAI